MADEAPQDRYEHPLTRMIMQILWPAFLMAIVAAGLFFSLIDPRELGFVAEWLDSSRGAAYTIGFLLFWALFACSSVITYFLAHGTRAGRGSGG